MLLRDLFIETGGAFLGAVAVLTLLLALFG